MDYKRVGQGSSCCPADDGGGKSSACILLLHKYESHLIWNENKAKVEWASKGSSSCPGDDGGGKVLCSSLLLPLHPMQSGLELHSLIRIRKVPSAKKCSEVQKETVSPLSHLLFLLNFYHISPLMTFSKHRAQTFLTSGPPS